MGTLATTIGRNLRQLRKRAGLTQVQAGDRADVKQNTLSVWENGEIALETLDRIEGVAIALGGTAEDLLLPPPPVPQEYHDLIAAFDALDDRERQRAIGYLQGKADKARRSGRAADEA